LLLLHLQRLLAVGMRMLLLKPLQLLLLLLLLLLLPRFQRKWSGLT
jgi:hypothetical protein